MRKFIAVALLAAVPTLNLNLSTHASQNHQPKGNQAPPKGKKAPPPPKCPAEYPIAFKGGCHVCE